MNEETPTPTPTPTPTTTSAAYTAHALATMRRRMAAIADKVRMSYNKSQTWDELENKLRVVIPPKFKSLPYSYPTVITFATIISSNIEENLHQQIQALKDSAVSLKVYPPGKCRKYHKVKAFKEQQPVIDEITQRIIGTVTSDTPLFKKHLACLQDGQTGSGKTIVMGGVIADIINKHPEILSGRLPFNQFLVLTPKPVVPTIQRVFEDMGLGSYLDIQVNVLPYSQLTTKFGQILFTEEYTDPFTEETIVRFRRGMEPAVVFFDECQTLGNLQTKRTKIALSLMTETKRPPYAVFLSATPFDVPLKAATFLTSARVNFNSVIVNKDNCKNLLSLVSAKPYKPSKAGAQRLRQLCSPYIVSFPRVKWPHRVFNSVRVCDFTNPEDKQAYLNTEKNYLERLRLSGRLPPSHQALYKMTLLQQFAMRAEPSRMGQFALWALEDISNNFAPVIGCVYKHSLTRIAVELHKRGMTRDQMSIIWGGRKRLNKELYLSPPELEALISKVRGGETLSDAEFRKLQTSVAYRVDAVANNELTEDGLIDREAQDKRHALLKSLKLLQPQTAAHRQEEIDRFQYGITKVCLFTAAAGGVGLSLDHRIPKAKPRVGYFPPLYSGPLFVQMLGRTNRRPTISDTHQYIGILRDTIEEHHIADILDKKLQFLATVSKTFSPLEIVDAIAKEKSGGYKFKERALQEVIDSAADDESQITDLSAIEELDEDEDMENGSEDKDATEDNEEDND